MSEISFMSIDPVPLDEMTSKLRAVAEAAKLGTPEEIGQWQALVGVWAHAPEHAERFLPFYARVGENKLGPKITELVRFSIANVNQCPACMAASAPAAVVEEGLTDEQRSYVTELDKGDFTPRERAAIRFALNFAGDHHSIDEAQWEELRAVFDTQEIVELCFYCMTFVGTGRLATVIGLINAACALPGARLQPPKVGV